jgi:hypothetical protein
VSSDATLSLYTYNAWVEVVRMGKKEREIAINFWLNHVALLFIYIQCGVK